MGNSVHVVTSDTGRRQVKQAGGCCLLTTHMSLGFVLVLDIARHAHGFVTDQVVFCLKLRLEEAEHLASYLATTLANLGSLVTFQRGFWCAPQIMDQGYSQKWLCCSRGLGPLAEMQRTVH